VDDVTYDEDLFQDEAALVRDDAKDALTHLVELAEEFRDADDADWSSTIRSCLAAASHCR
jgi:hypothetical protein